MSFDEWINQGSPKALAGAIAVAVFGGLGAGAWMSLPDYLAQPVSQSEPQMIHVDDPGREKWAQVVASLGGLGATFVVPASFRSEPTYAPEFLPDLQEQIAMTSAEIDAELREADRRAEIIRAEWDAPRRYAYTEPVSYAPQYEPRYAAEPRYAPSPPYEHQRLPQAYAAPAPVYAPARPYAPAYEDGPSPPPPPRPSQGW
jgi:hypothetical protein